MIDDLQVLKTSERLADDIWQQVMKWGGFARDTVGKQLVRAVDSTGANVAEAYGRFHYGEKLQFLYYSRGSIYETKYWLNRARSRGLLSDAKASQYLHDIHALARQLNGFLSYIKKLRTNNQNTLKESSTDYFITHNSQIYLFTEEELAMLLLLEN